MLGTELARTEGLLYRRGTFGGTLDDLICDALLPERDAEIALSPGFRWGGTLIAGPGRDLGGHLQRHRHHLSGRLPHAHEGRDDQGRSWRTWPTTCSTPIPTTSRAATWCGSAAWATPSTSTPPWARASPTCTCWRSGAPIAGRQGLRRGRAGARSTRPSRARRSGTWSRPISRAASVLSAAAAQVRQDRPCGGLTLISARLVQAERRPYAAGLCTNRSGFSNVVSAKAEIHAR